MRRLIFQSTFFGSGLTPEPKSRMITKPVLVAVRGIYAAEEEYVFIVTKKIVIVKRIGESVAYHNVPAGTLIWIDVAEF